MFKKLFRRCRLLCRRYPLLPFLLTATLAVDVIIANRDHKLTGIINDFLAAFLLGQFVLIGVGTAYKMPGISSRLCLAIPLVALLVFFSNQEVTPNDTEYIFVCVVLFSLTALVVFLSNIIYNRKILSVPRFRVASLLRLCTSVAVGITLIKLSKFGFVEIDIVAFSLVFSFVGILLWLVSKKKSWLLSLISIGLLMGLLYAFLYSYCIWYLSLGTPDSLAIIHRIVAPTTLGFAGVILLWLHGLQVRRRPIRHRKIIQQATPIESEQPVALNVVRPEEDPPEPAGPIDLTV